MHVYNLHYLGPMLKAQVWSLCLYSSAFLHSEEAKVQETEKKEETYITTKLRGGKIAITTKSLF